MPKVGRFPYQKLLKYPHLETEDIITWERFIDKFPKAYTSVDYDFALSKVEQQTKAAGELGIPGAERVYKYRIDAIGYGDNEIHLIEIKKRATPQILGQLDSENTLYLRDEAAGKKTKMIVVCRELAPEMEMLAKDYNITLILV